MKNNTVRAIFASDDEGGIGKNGDLPWPHNSADLKWFKEKTTNSTVIMGRNTWESLPVKPLPNRRNIVVTTGNANEAHIVGDLKSILKILPQIKGNVWIIGGAQLIEGMLPYIEEFYISKIDGIYDCDVFLPLTKIQEEFTITKIEIQSDVKYEIWTRVSR